MYEAAWRYRGPGMAAMASIGAVDVALWDLYGKPCGEPVWGLLGGHRDRVTVYADGIGYADQPPDEVAALVKKHADLGYDAVKIHLTSPDADVALEKVRLSREALGPDRKLLLDVWSMWDGEMAAEMARRFAPYNLYWIEEPVRRDDELSYLRMVRDSTDALLAGGEGQGTLYGARRLITEGGLQLLQTDILVGGGFTGLMRIAAMAEAHHVPISPMLCLPVARGRGHSTARAGLITEGGLQLLQTDILVGGGFTGLMRIAAMAEAHHVPISPHGAQYPRDQLPSGGRRAQRPDGPGLSTSSDYVRVMDQRLCQWLLCQANSYPVR